MSTSGSRFKAVIFDLDGVITDTAHYHFQAWRRLAEDEGVPFDAAFNEKLKGVDRMGSLELILAQSPRSYTLDQKFALAERKNAHYRELIAGITPADVLPGALEALDSVRAAGLKTALASVSKNAFTVLERLRIRPMFDDVVDANHIKHSKPHPEIFLTAAAHLGLRPADCMGVEDAVAGVASIKSAGMFALGVGERAILQNADRVIPDLRSFRLQDY